MNLLFLALLAYAVFEFLALLALAGLGDLAPARLALLGARLALGRVGRLLAHFAAHAVATLALGLGLARLARLVMRRLGLGHALLAGLGILGLRAVEALAARLAGIARRRLREYRGAQGEQYCRDESFEHGKSFR